MVHKCVRGGYCLSGLWRPKMLPVVLPCIHRQHSQDTRSSSAFNRHPPHNSATSGRAGQNTGSAALVNRDFISLSTFDREDIERILWTALDLKGTSKNVSVAKPSESGSPLSRASEDRAQMWMPTAPMPQHLSGFLSHLVFETPDIHQRLSIEAGMHLFGGTTSYLAPGDIHFTTPEALSDTMTTFACCSHLIWCRLRSHAFVEQMARECSVPIINVGTFLENPIVALAHLLTLYETYGTLRGLTFAWIGQPTAVLNSLLLSASYFGAKFKIALSPVSSDAGDIPQDSGLQSIDSTVFARALQACSESNAEIHYVSDAQDALWRAHVVLCDNAIESSSVIQQAVNEKFKNYESTLPALPTLPKNVKSLIRRDAEAAELRRTPSLAAYMDGKFTSPPPVASLTSGTSIVSYEENRLEQNMIEQADLEWTFLHSLPRTSKEVSNAVHYGENARSFASVANRKWICAAIALQLTRAYKPLTMKPNFMAF